MLTLTVWSTGEWMYIFHDLTDWHSLCITALQKWCLYCYALMCIHFQWLYLSNLSTYSIVIYGSIWLAGLGWTCHMSVKAWVDQYARNVKLKYLNPFSLDNTSFTWFTAHFFCCLDESTWCHVVSTSPALYLSCCGPRKEDISGAFWWTRASKM